MSRGTAIPTILDVHILAVWSEPSLCVLWIAKDTNHLHAASKDSEDGRLGEAKVTSILRQRGVQLILAYNWARPASLVAGKARGGWGCFYFFCFFTFIHFPFSPVPLLHFLYYLFYLSSPFFWETTQNEPQGLTSRKHTYMILTPLNPTFI